MQGRNTDTDVGNKRMNTKGETGRGTIGMNWETGIDIYTLVILVILCIKQMSNENILCSSENSTQCSVVIFIKNKTKQRYGYM